METLYDGCVVIAAAVGSIKSAVQDIVKLNYDIITDVSHAVSQLLLSVLQLCSQIKSFSVSVTIGVTGVITYIYAFFASCLWLLWWSLNSVYTFIQSCYSSLVEGFSSCTYYTSNMNFISSTTNCALSVTASAVTAILIFVTTIRNVCIGFVTGVWQGLGFVLSSVAYIPVYCKQCVDDAWRKCTNTVYDAFIATPKETYLAIMVMCLLYLTLSKALHYAYCHGITILPCRLRRRRRNTNSWHIDRSFESDFEDLYASDTDDRVWTDDYREDAANDDETDSNREDDIDDDPDETEADGDISDNASDAEDSDEYTVITEEESDSDVSINSHTYSIAEFSDHEIDVQLPSTDECISLYSRSSTPSSISKRMSSPEDFDREMERERDKRKCVVCQDRIKSVLVMPCKHMCMCIRCADQIVKSRVSGRRVCPLCRTKIEKVLNVYV